MNRQEALNLVAKKLGTNPQWLDKLINFESRWNPQATNPNSGARGLIQFMPDTARDLGYKDANDLIQWHPTELDQLLNPVYTYLAQFGTLDSEQKLYMAVFYPAAMTWPLDKQFPDYVQKANIIGGQPIRTPRDYINLVNYGKVQTAARIGAGVILGAIAIFLILTRGKL